MRDYWTEADQAELDVLIAELVRVAFIHKDLCPVCRDETDESRLNCKPLRGAIVSVLEWRQGRALRSKAQWLREREQAAIDDSDSFRWMSTFT